MKKNILFTAFLILTTFFAAFPQSDSGIKLFTDRVSESYVGDMSGNGRFVVFQSNGNIATHNPRNSDKNFEIFLLDYAQRHIFQITDTKNALRNLNDPPTQNSNILVKLSNAEPSMSNDGRWIAFGSNGTTSSVNSPNNTNPGNLDGNGPGNLQILQQDGAMEIWLYRLPDYPTVDLSSGVTPNFVNLSDGSLRWSSYSAHKTFFAPHFIFNC
jgi:Tol biopolymer transport system component